MAEKVAPPAQLFVANKNTTEIEVPQTMHIESAPVAADPDQREPAAAPSGAEPPSQIPNPRDAIMETIYANRSKAIERELTLANDIARESPQSGAPAETDTPEGAAATPSPEPVPAPAEGGAPSPEPVAAAPEALKTHTIIVDGQKIDVSQDDLMRLAQQGLSSQQRYQAAAQLRNEAARLAQLGQSAPQQAPQNSAPQAQPAAVDDTTVADIVRRLNYGSEEEQKKAVGDILNVAARTQGQGQSLTQDQLVNIAEERAVNRIRFEQNLQTIVTEFKDVFDDRGLSLVAADRVNALRNFYLQQGVQKPDIDLYREACFDVKKKYLAPATQASTAENSPPSNSIQAAPQVSPMKEKLERKRVAPQPPAAASKVANDAPTQKAYKPSDVVAQMRKARHQPAY